MGRTGNETRAAADSPRLSFAIRVIFWVAGLAVGATQAWTHRFQLSSDDAIAYLDIGDAYVRGDWHSAVNAYWSPLYSWFLGLALHVVKPSLRWEFAVVKLVNLAIFLFAFAAFELLLREVMARYKARLGDDPMDGADRVPDWAWRALGYTLFLWSSLEWIGLGCDTPDLSVAALVYVAAALLLRISERSRWIDFAMLGVVLGFAFLAKAVMFPIAFVFLGVAMAAAGSLRRGLVALVAFAVVVAPFVVAISIAHRRPTFGETGRLNYAWMVERDVKPYRFWEGIEPHGGRPLHPPRLLFERPDVFEFASPVGGTYPPWHDPSYWYDGLEIRIRPAYQLSTSTANAVFYLQTFLGGTVVVYLLIVGFGAPLSASVRALKGSWILIIPAVAGLGVYLVGTHLPGGDIDAQPSTRLIAPFVVLLVAGVISSVRLSGSPAARRRLTATVVALVAASGARLSYQLVGDVTLRSTNDAAVVQVEIADALSKLGVRAGDRVAISGAYIFPNDHWARLARVKIVAEVSSSTDFWERDSATRSEIVRRIAGAGARVLVQKPGATPPDDAPGWRSIGHGYYALFLQ